MMLKHTSFFFNSAGIFSEPTKRFGNKQHIWTIYEKNYKDWHEESNVEKKVSERELARRIGWTRQYLNGISCGRVNPSIEQLERIAEALGMTLHISFEEGV